MHRASPVPGAAFGPYRILSLLGEGGGGSVYRAWDPRLERDVALKILHERADRDSARAQRFVAEARAASALNHPNIVTVFDAAFDGDTPYVVSELIDGRTLRDDLDGGPVATKRFLDLAAQIADGLSAAHEAGIVHRDLKPENIMVTRAGRVKIVDFGLADPGGFRESSDTADADDHQTRTDLGLRAGTVPYMSPEQARGIRGDHRSDQFSLGLVLFEMASGRPAFRRDTPAATLDAIINDEANYAAAFDPRMPVPVRWIVERCLSKEPSDRYAVTADLHRDLKTLRDRFGELASAGAGPPSSRGGSIWRRALGVAIVIASFVAGFLLSGVPGDPPLESATGFQFVPVATDPGYEGFPAWSPDGQTIAYVAEVNDTLQVFARRLSSSGAVQLTRAPYDCKYPFWSPDGKRVYYVSLAHDRESIWSVGAAGGTPQLVVSDASRGAIASDGTIAFLRDEQPSDIVGASALWIATASGRQSRYAPFGSLRFVEGALAFSPDGRTIGLSAVPRSTNVPPDARGWQFWIVPLSDERPYRRLQSWSNAVPRVSSFTWMPDSRHVVLGLATLSTPGSHLWMADLQEDRAWPLTNGPGSESYPSASPSGTDLVFASGEPDYDVVEISLDHGATRPLFGTARNESDPTWSRDGTVFAYVTDRAGTDEIWWRGGGRSGDSPLIQQTDFGSDDRTIMLGSPSFSPDGQRIAYQRNAFKPIWPLRIWISQTGGGPPVPLVPAEREGYEGAPTWSPDGQWIAYTEWTNRQWALAKVRVGSGEPPVILRTDGVPNAAPCWSPKDDWITWETERGFSLVSPDGARQRILSEDHWLVHTWSRDGSQILGVRESEQLRLLLVSLDSRTGRERVISDLGPSPPVNNPVRGLSLAADGRTLVTSLLRLRGDLWSIDGVRWRQEVPRWRSWFPFR